MQHSETREEWKSKILSGEWKSKVYHNGLSTNAKHTMATKNLHETLNPEEKPESALTDDDRNYLEIMKWQKIFKDRDAGIPQNIETYRGV